MQRTLLRDVLLLAVVLGCNPYATSSSSSSPGDARVREAPGRVEPNAPIAAAPLPLDAASRDPPEARALRIRLVDELAESGYVRSQRVLDAMTRVPRHLFVPGASLRAAYGDYPLPIGYEQTISQPAIVGEMTEALELTGKERVLEIGTGSGYQAAILSLLAAKVFSIEIVAPLGEIARARLAELGYANVEVRIGDGYKGWPEHAPFDAVIVTAAPPELPKALVDQLVMGGVLVVPLGPERAQQLKRFRKTPSGLKSEDLGAVEFVPMVPGE